VGDSFSVWELLHAMMLPSGNDASIALAEYFGDLLIKDNYMNSKTPLPFAKPKQHSATKTPALLLSTKFT
jgi:hypothetical protein